MSRGNTFANLIRGDVKYQPRASGYQASWWEDKMSDSIKPVTTKNLAPHEVFTFFADALFLLSRKANANQVLARMYQVIINMPAPRDKERQIKTYLHDRATTDIPIVNLDEMSLSDLDLYSDLKAALQETSAFTGDTLVAGKRFMDSAHSMTEDDLRAIHNDLTANYKERLRGWKNDELYIMLRDMMLTLTSEEMQTFCGVYCLYLLRSAVKQPETLHTALKDKLPGLMSNMYGISITFPTSISKINTGACSIIYPGNTLNSVVFPLVQILMEGDGRDTNPDLSKGGLPGLFQATFHLALSGNGMMIVELFYRALVTTGITDPAELLKLLLCQTTAATTQTLMSFLERYNDGKEKYVPYAKIFAPDVMPQLGPRFHSKYCMILINVIDPSGNGDIRQLKIAGSDTVPDKEVRIMAEQLYKHIGRNQAVAIGGGEEYLSPVMRESYKLLTGKEQMDRGIHPQTTHRKTYTMSKEEKAKDKEIPVRILPCANHSAFKPEAMKRVSKLRDEQFMSLKRIEQLRDRLERARSDEEAGELGAELRDEEGYADDLEKYISAQRVEIERYNMLYSGSGEPPVNHDVNSMF